VLDLLCRRVEHVGDHGAAASLKLAINLPLLVFWQAFGEANALVRHLGLDPAWLVEFFADTSGAPTVLKNRGAAIAATLAGAAPGAVTFDIDSIRKDLSTMVAEAGSRGVPLPAASAALASFDEASAAGWGERDCTWLPAFWAAKAK
ncbi:MAG: NAD-binding protein, partial [Pseudomonadota bacterium]|nr:NAD-binding protein [Pseudomonadota bacterium]